MFGSGRRKEEIQVTFRRSRLSSTSKASAQRFNLITLALAHFLYFISYISLLYRSSFFCFCSFPRLLYLLYFNFSFIFLSYEVQFRSAATFTYVYSCFHPPLVSATNQIVFGDSWGWDKWCVDGKRMENIEKDHQRPFLFAGLFHKSWDIDIFPSF